MTRTVRAPALALRVRAVAGRAVGTVILIGLAIWLAANFIHAPTQFFQSGIDGLSNGVLYALIALGYTLVYGIIELINFAHGDLFMLGTLFSGFLVTTVLKLNHSSVEGWLGFAMTLVAAMV